MREPTPNEKNFAQCRGGVMMKPTSFEDAIRLQFATLMKKVIDKTIKNYERSLARRNKREVLFCELPEIMVQSFLPLMNMI